MESVSNTKIEECQTHGNTHLTSNKRGETSNIMTCWECDSNGELVNLTKKRDYMHSPSKPLVTLVANNQRSSSEDCPCTSGSTPTTMGFSSEESSTCSSATNKHIRCSNSFRRHHNSNASFNNDNCTECPTSPMSLSVLPARTVFDSFWYQTVHKVGNVDNYNEDHICFKARWVENQWLDWYRQYDEAYVTAIQTNNDHESIFMDRKLRGMRVTAMLSTLKTLREQFYYIPYIPASTPLDTDLSANEGVANHSFKAFENSQRKKDRQYVPIYLPPSSPSAMVYYSVPGINTKATIYETTVRVVCDDLLTTASAFLERNYDPAVVMFVNPSTPGHEYKTGGSGKEEDFVRRTDLSERYAVVLDEDAYPLGEFTALYYEGVRVFRDTERTGFRYLSSPFQVDLITIGSYDLELTKPAQMKNSFKVNYERDRGDDVPETTCFDERRFICYLRRKLECAAAIALANGHDCLIVSPMDLIVDSLTFLFKISVDRILEVFRAVLSQFSSLFVAVAICVNDFPSLQFKHISFSSTSDLQESDSLTTEFTSNSLSFLPSNPRKSKPRNPFALCFIKALDILNLSGIPLCEEPYAFTSLPPCLSGGHCHRIQEYSHRRTYSHPVRCPNYDLECLLLDDSDHTFLFVHSAKQCKQAHQLQRVNYYPVEGDRVCIDHHEGELETVSMVLGTDVPIQGLKQLMRTRSSGLISRNVTSDDGQRISRSSSLYVTKSDSAERDKSKSGSSSIIKQDKNLSHSNLCCITCDPSNDSSKAKLDRNELKPNSLYELDEEVDALLADME